MKLWILGIALMGIAVATTASEISGQIIEVRTGPYYGSIVAIKLSPAPTGLPTCNTLGDRGHYLIDTSSSNGKQWLAVVLSAYASEKPVHIWGSGSCIAAGSYDGESLETIASQ